MGFWQKLNNLFTARPPSGSKDDGYYFQVKCKRCGEVITTRVNVYNDLSVEYDEKGNPESYYCRKVVMGENRCYQQIEVGLKFNTSRKLVDKTISGGTFVETEAGSRE
jgi:hypothetical protein